jgi:uncharacterized protein
MKYYSTLLLLFILIGCRNGSFVGQTGQTINVTGYSELKVNPDVALISLNAVVRAYTKKAVVSEITRTVDSVLNQINTKQIRTEKPIINNLNIYWNYIEEKDKPRITEYTAMQTIEIKMDFNMDEIEKMVQIVSDVPRLNFSINFDIAKSRKDSLENVVSAMAIKDAAKKAENIAAASNLEIVKILDITYQSDHPGAFMKSNMMQREFASSDMAARVNLAPREIEMNDNIKLTYMVRNKR